MNLAVNLFSGIFLLIITVLLMLDNFDPVYWMILSGFAMYLPYIIFHTVYFERWIAYFKIKSNIGFLMYISMPQAIWVAHLFCYSKISTPTKFPGLIFSK